MVRGKKILSLILAAAAAGTVLAATAFAEETQDATFCFDKNSTVSMWSTYGAVEETGLKLSIDSEIRESGGGSLCISEKVTEDVPSDKQFGGAFVTADLFGLESFAGCTFQLSAYLDKTAAESTDSFNIFSDGIVWMESKVSADTASGHWAKVSLTVPETAKNTRLGFAIPVYKTFEGKAAYVDNVIIYDADGNIIANMGDYDSGYVAGQVSISNGGRIALIIVLILIIAGLVAAGFLFFKSRVGRFR